jgi:hypothetical protein
LPVPSPGTDGGDDGDDPGGVDGAGMEGGRLMSGGLDGGGMAGDAAVTWIVAAAELPPLSYAVAVSV